MRTARLAAGRPGACRKSLFDTLSNETRFTGLSFERGCGSLQRTKGTPFARLRAERYFLRRTRRRRK